jgi:PA14 domain-containing protein
MRAPRGACWALLLLIPAATQADASQLRQGGERESSKGSKLPKARKVKLPMELTGEVYFLDSKTERLPDFSKMTAVQTIRVKGLNVTARDYLEGFPGVKNRFEYFGIDFAGTITVRKQGKYVFVLTSDDGSKLFIDGEMLIDNDGLHLTLQPQEGEIDLDPGIHRIRVPYFQGPRSSLALVLEVYWIGE